MKLASDDSRTVKLALASGHDAPSTTLNIRASDADHGIPARVANLTSRLFGAKGDHRKY
ncbi:MAG: hypothetical protein P4L53_07545 [Candidatus Obscuribacterales bacterium]|nr:hypothetical protein [Candidatus Obscuribacterales bacterium]